MLYKLLQQQLLIVVFDHLPLCHGADTFQVPWSGLRICRSGCLESPSRAHSSPVHTCNL